MERAANLSLGQRQLIAIARAVLADPRVLILDEATSNVDPRTEVRLQQALNTLLAGRTSLVVAHRLSTIRAADQVLVIDGGEIVERGRHEELLQRRGAYYQPLPAAVRPHRGGRRPRGRSLPKHRVERTPAAQPPGRSTVCSSTA